MSKPSNFKEWENSLDTKAATTLLVYVWQLPHIYRSAEHNSGYTNILVLYKSMQNGDYIIIEIY